MAAQPTIAGTGAVLAAVRTGQARTRTDLVTHTGLARGTLARRLDQLLGAGLLRPSGEQAVTGGRPSETFQLDPAIASMLVADVGASRARVAISDLLGEILVEAELPIDVGSGPEPVLAAIHQAWSDLVVEVGDPPPIRGVGVSIPGPVDQVIGGTVSPPIMTGWDRVPLRDLLAERYRCLAWVENDVNAMALGEHRAVHGTAPALLYVKVGTGVGAGLVLAGDIFRGAVGAAGDIGHIQMEGVEQRDCRCGMRGCVEAVAGGWALRQQLAERGIEVDSSRAVVELVRRGDPVAVDLVRTAGRVLGGAISHAVNLVNPSVVVVGGDLAHAHEQLLAGIREVVYQRSLPLATADLRIVPSELDRRAGVVGVSTLVADRLLDPVAVDLQFAEGAGWWSGSVPAAELLHGPPPVPTR